MIELTRRGNVAVLTLSRPPVNALDAEMLAAIHGALDTLPQHAGCTVVHIRSTTKVFVAGADISYMCAMTGKPNPGAEMTAYLEPFQGLFKRIEALPQVVIAEINGAALGGGFELALACDLRYAALEAKLGLPEVGLGLIPGAGGTQRLTRICGRGLAGRLIYGAEPVDGATALSLGMVQWACQRAELEEKTRALADRIATLPAQALQAAKACVHAFGNPAVDGYQLEIEKSAKLIASEDAKRQMTTFLERSKK